MNQPSLLAQRVRNLPTMLENWVCIPGLGRPLEKGMATHSSILAWRILWTEEPAGDSPWCCKQSDTTERLILLLFFTLMNG